LKRLEKGREQKQFIAIPMEIQYVKLFLDRNCQMCKKIVVLI
jgi:hypothetical protein